MTGKVYRIEWRPMARDDLRSIVRYIAKNDPERAKGFGQGIRDKTEALARHPELGRTGRPSLPVDLRELVAHPNYLVFYCVLTKVRIVQILRVKHAAQHTPCPDARQAPAFLSAPGNKGQTTVLSHSF